MPAGTVGLSERVRYRGPGTQRAKEGLISDVFDDFPSVKKLFSYVILLIEIIYTNIIKRKDLYVCL